MDSRLRGNDKKERLPRLSDFVLNGLAMGIYAKNVAIWGQNRNTNGNNQLAFLPLIRGADDNVL
jgi:hypothetical protein